MWTCIECEFEYTADVDGDAEERMCFKCLYPEDEEEQTKYLLKLHMKNLGLRKNQKIDGYFMGVDFIKVKTSYKNCSNLVTIRMSSGNIVDVRNLGSRV